MDYLTPLLTVFSWGLYAVFAVRLATTYRQYQRDEGAQSGSLALWLTLWVFLASGILVYFTMYPVGIAGMVWVAVNVGLMLPLMDQRGDGASQSSGRLLRVAVSMALLSTLILAICWPLTVLRPETEPYRYVAVLIAGIASVMFILAIVAAWRRWRSGRAQSC